MGLQTAVAAPFRRRGEDRLSETEFVAAVAMELGWFTPDQTKRLIDIAVTEGLLAKQAGQLEPMFDIDETAVPEDFVPDESILQQRSVFEHILESIEAAGVEKQTAVADINQLQDQLDLTVEAAAILYARKQEIDVDNQATRARTALLEE